MANLNISNAQGVPMYVFLLWVIIAMALGVLAFTFKGSVQV